MEDVLQPNGAGLYIATTPVPDEATAYARGSIAGMLRNEYDLTRVTLRTPFAVQGEDCDLDYFVVMYDGSIVGTYRVFPLDDSHYTGIYAEDSNMATALNALADTTNYLSPAKIGVGEYEDLYAVTPTSEHTVLSDYAGRVTPVKAARVAASTMTVAAETVSVVDASENIGFIDSVSDTRSMTDYIRNWE